MATQSFDQLNNAQMVEFRKVFESMVLSQDEIDRRVDLAWKFWESWLFFCLLYVDTEMNGFLNQSVLQKAYQEEILLRVLTDDMLDDKYITDNIASAVQSIVNTTLLHKGIAYYLSDERGMAIAIEQANRIGNYQQFLRESETATMKTWRTSQDDLVRATHDVMDGITIPIDEMFCVNGYLMRFPMDDEYGAPDQEIINCRCSLEFR